MCECVKLGKRAVCMCTEKSECERYCERLETVLAKWQLGSLLVQAWI